jgi:hypothetical protein
LCDYIATGIGSWMHSIAREVTHTSSSINSYVADSLGWAGAYNFFNAFIIMNIDFLEHVNLSQRPTLPIHLLTMYTEGGGQ